MEENCRKFIKQLLDSESKWKNGMSETLTFKEKTYTISRERLNPPSKKYVLSTETYDKKYSTLSLLLLDMVNENSENKQYESIEDYINET